MIRIGLVGAGPWAGLYHAPMLAAAPDVEFVGVWARRAEAAHELAGTHGVRAFASFDDLVAGCDAVSFCVPPQVQADLGARAARAGRHVVLEKPIATSVADAEDLAAAVSEAGVASIIVLRFRYGTVAAHFLGAAAAGTVRSVTSSFVSNSTRHESVFATPWRVAAPHALLDLGPHTLDMVEATAGPVTTLSAALSGGVLTIITTHRDGATGTVVVSAVTPGADGPLTCTAVTDAGRVVLADPDSEPLADVQLLLMADFVRSIGDGVPSVVDVRRGVHLQRLLAAVDTSLSTGGPVAIES